MKTKYNDYIYGFTTKSEHHFNISIRIELTSEVEPSQIHKLLCDDAVKKAKAVGLNVSEDKVNFKFISLVYSGEYEEQVDNTK